MKNKTAKQPRDEFQAKLRKPDLWSPSRKTLMVVGLLGADNLVTEDPAEMARLLAAEWSPTFANKTINLEVAAKAISTWTTPMNLEGVTPPPVAA